MTSRAAPIPRVALAAIAVLAALLMLAAGARAATVTVAPGETLSDIALRHGVGVAELAAANGLSDPDLVRAGAALVVPEPDGAGDAGYDGAEAAATPARTGTGGHLIAPGETLSGIAARYGTTVAAVAEANGLTAPYLIVAGETLTIPAGGYADAGYMSPAGAGTTSDPEPGPEPEATAPAGAGGHIVAPGETLSRIAADHGTTVAALAAANGIADPDLIPAGRVLTIVPGGDGAAASGAAATARTAPADASVGDLITERALAHGVDPALARAVAWQESGWNQAITSEAGATGVMQLMPGTAEWLGDAVLGRPVDRHDLPDNVDAGVAYLAWLERATGGDLATTIAAYYQGLAGVRERGWYDDTRDYVDDVLALRDRM